MYVFEKILYISLPKQIQMGIILRFTIRDKLKNEVINIMIGMINLIDKMSDHQLTLRSKSDSELVLGTLDLILSCNFQFTLF